MQVGLGKIDFRNLKGQKTPKFNEDNTVSKTSSAARCIVEDEFTRCKTKKICFVAWNGRECKYGDAYHYAHIKKPSRYALPDTIQQEYDKIKSFFMRYQITQAFFLIVFTLCLICETYS